MFGLSKKCTICGKRLEEVHQKCSYCKSPICPDCVIANKGWTYCKSCWNRFKSEGGFLIHWGKNPNS